MIIFHEIKGIEDIKIVFPCDSKHILHQGSKSRRNIIEWISSIQFIILFIVYNLFVFIFFLFNPKLFTPTGSLPDVFFSKPQQLYANLFAFLRWPISWRQIGLITNISKDTLHTFYFFNWLAFLKFSEFSVKIKKTKFC